MWLALGLLLITACKPGVPKDVIQPDDMEDILYDFHLAQGVGARDGDEGIEYKQIGRASCRERVWLRV